MFEGVRVDAVPYHKGGGRVKWIDGGGTAFIIDGTNVSSRSGWRCNDGGGTMPRRGSDIVK